MNIINNERMVDNKLKGGKNSLFSIAFTILLLPFLGYYIYKYRKSFLTYQTLRKHLIRMNTNNVNTIALGLHQRFNNKKDPETDKYPNPSFTEDDKDFEYFVADIYESLYGGNAVVVGGPDDLGVDIEHERKDGLYLGQVKCYDPKTNPVDYKVIAILHSNMVKRNSVGGFVVTTSNYTKTAEEYAKDLNIELIDGAKLVHEWNETSEKSSLEYTPRNMSEIEY